MAKYSMRRAYLADSAPLSPSPLPTFLERADQERLIQQAVQRALQDAKLDSERAEMEMRQLRVEVMRLQAKHMAKHEAEAKLEQLAQAALQADEITRKHLTKMSDKMATVTVRQRRRSRSAGDPRNQTYVEEEDTCGSSFHSTRYEIMGNLALRLMTYV